MTTITPQSAAKYYALSSDTSSQTSGSGAPGSSTASTSTTTAAAASTPSLAYYLSLSDDAQSYLSSLTGSSDSSNTPAVPGLPSSSTTTPTSSTYPLNQEQQHTLSDILAKYKDAPYTQDTYDQIQTDLTAAGLDPTTLGAQDQVRTTNLSLLLLDAMNGTSNAPTPDSAATIAGKSSNYMANVLTQWKNISTTAGDATTPAADDGTTSSAS